MADDERTANTTTALLEKPPAPSHAPAGAPPASAKKGKKKNKNEKGIDEYDVEFETPFGKFEFEFEPKSTKDRKDREKRENKAAAAAKAAEKARKQAEKNAAKLEKKGLVAAAMPEPRRGGGNLLPILLIFAVIAGAIAVAIWLFARPGDEDLDQVPQEFLNDAPVEGAPPPQGFVAKARARVRDAVRAGKQASRETQAEQQKKFEDLTGTR